MVLKTYQPYRVPLQKSNSEWLVSDFYSAAWLHACGHELLGLEREVGNHGTRAVFLFSDSGVFEADYDRFIAGEEIGVQKFLASVKVVKCVLRNR